MDYELLKNGNVKVGEKISNFIANSTKGIIDLEKTKNNILLFSYKEDFYNIAELEIIELQKNKKTFENLKTEIILMTSGNLLSHYAWIENIKYKTGIEIEFPIIEDRIGEQCRKYGMCSKENNNQILNKAILINQEKIVTGILEYPNTIPRNIYEIIRVLNFQQM